MVSGKWGYIDTTGKMVIQPMPLKRAEEFHHGLAFVSTKDGKYGYVGQVRVDPDAAVPKLGSLPGERVGGLLENCFVPSIVGCREANHRDV